MTLELSHYLENIRHNSKLGHSDESEVISEIEAHIEDRLQELKESGLSEEEAINTCLGQMGSAGLVAHRIYEAYSQGSWKQVLLASTPHLLFGLMFVLNWWQHIGWLSLMLLLVLGTAIYGWWHGKPTWVFSWLGYCRPPPGLSTQRVVAAGNIAVYPAGFMVGGLYYSANLGEGLAVQLFNAIANTGYHRLVSRRVTRGQIHRK
jgi:hypothetical protein